MTLSELKQYITNPLDPDQYSDLVDYLNDSVLLDDLSEKEKLVNYLSGLFSTWGEKIDTANSKNYEKLQFLWLTLALDALPILEDTDQDNLLQKKIFSAITKGYEPDRIIQEFYMIFSSEEFLTENIFKRFKEDLETNGETFGSLPIEVEGKRMLPNIKYWLLDYAKFPSKISKRGSVERLNYITQSANVRQLTQGQRQYLSKLLKFYDDLISGEAPLNLREHDTGSVPASYYRNNPAYATENTGADVNTNINANIDKKLNDLRQRSQR